MSSYFESIFNESLTSENNQSNQIVAMLEQQRVLLEDMYSVADLKKIDQAAQELMDNFIVRDTPKNSRSASTAVKYKNLPDIMKDSKKSKKLDQICDTIEKTLDKTFNVKSSIKFNVEHPTRISFGMCIYRTKEEIAGIIKDAIATKEGGYKIHKQSKADIVIQEGFLKLLDYYGMNGRHITAVLLHEIGHKVFCESQTKIAEDGRISELKIMGVAIPSYLVAGLSGIAMAEKASMFVPIIIVVAALVLSLLNSVMDKLRVKTYTGREVLSDRVAVEYGYGKEIYETMGAFERYFSGGLSKSGSKNSALNSSLMRREEIINIIHKELENPNNTKREKKDLKDALTSILKYKDDYEIEVE